MSLSDGMAWEKDYGTECYKNMENKLPTFEQCIETIKELNSTFINNKDEIEHRACILYLINRISFWEDFPVLYKLIDLEKKLYPKK